MDLPTRLRSAIGELHDRIEATPLARAMADGGVGRAAYRALLGQLLVVHEPLEAALAAGPLAARVYEPAMARADVLRADLVAFGGFGPAEPLPAAAELINDVERWAATAPHALLGCLYVFEGSRMGSRILAVRLARNFEIPVEPGVGLDYHIQGMNERAASWPRFRAALAELPLGPAAADELVGAAVTSMARLCDLYSAIDPAAADAGCRMQGAS